MKTPLTLLRRLTPAALALPLLLTVTTARAQFPLGTWDCTVSEKQTGLAVVQFDPDFTFTGIQLMRPGSAPKAPDPNPRYTGGEPTRQGQAPVAATASPTSVFVGGNSLGGRWGYDDTGKVIGLLDQITRRYELVSKTNFFLVDTGLVAVVTNIFEVVNTTNAISFKASGVSNQRLTMVSYLPDGKRNVYRGLPAIQLADQSGPLFATGKRSGVPFVEFLSMAPSQDFPFLNFYDMLGNGAGYALSGFAMVSRTGRIAVYSQTDRTPYLITVHSGSYNSTTRRGSLNGYDSDGKKYTYRLVHN